MKSKIKNLMYSADAFLERRFGMQSMTSDINKGIWARIDSHGKFTINPGSPSEEETQAMVSRIMEVADALEADYLVKKIKTSDGYTVTNREFEQMVIRHREGFLSQKNFDKFASNILIWWVAKESIGEVA